MVTKQESGADIEQLITCLTNGEQPMDSSATIATDQNTSQSTDAAAAAAAATATENTTENRLPTMLVIFLLINAHLTVT